MLPAGAQKKGDRVRVLAGSAMRTAPGGVVVGVLSRAFEGPVEMVQGTAVRLRLNGYVSEQSVRMEPNRNRGKGVGAGNTGGVLRTGPSEKEPALATLRRGAIIFQGQKFKTFLAIHRTIWVDKSRLAKLAAAETGAAKPPSAASRSSVPILPKPTEKPAVSAVAGGGNGSVPKSRATSNPINAAVDVGELSAADLRADPRGTKGRVVRWTVEALSYQLADGLRRELNGEPYLLARGPGKERAMLYLAVPDSLVSAARALAPLTSISVIARVRSGKSEPGGVPILDLLELVRR